MIGVVIWSSRMTKKAVIWCEDQGALAYASEKTGCDSGMDWPEPGDLIGVETAETEALRQVTSMWLVNARACPQLPAALRAEASRPAAPPCAMASQIPTAPTHAPAMGQTQKQRSALAS